MSVIDVFPIDAKTSAVDEARLLSLASCTRSLFYGGLAQLARAPALQAGGQRFESVILHNGVNRMTKA